MTGRLSALLGAPRCILAIPFLEEFLNTYTILLLSPVARLCGCAGGALKCESRLGLRLRLRYF
jgi:hypothetical protein